MDINEILVDAGFENVVYLPDFDEECIIGISTEGKAIYSYEKMMDSLLKEGMDDIGAIDYLEYNTIHMLPNIDNCTNGMAPIIMHSRSWLGF